MKKVNVDKGVDEGGETRTLYVCKSPGFVIKVR